MLKNKPALLLIVFIVNLTFVFSAQAQSAKEERRVEKFKSTVAAVSENPKSRAFVVLKDGTKLEGFVREVAGDQFVLADKKTGAATTVRFEQIKNVRRTSSSGLKIVAGVGLIVGAVTFIFLAGAYGG